MRATETVASRATESQPVRGKLPAKLGGAERTLTYSAPDVSQRSCCSGVRPGMSPQSETKCVVLRSFGAPRVWRSLGAPLRGASLLGDFAKSPGDRGSPPGSRVLWCSCVSVCQSVPGREAAGTRLSGTPVKAELLVVQWLRVWHTTLLKTPYIPPRKQSDLPRGPPLHLP